MKALMLNESAAVAPTLALALFALIGVGGLAFDYARLAAMDTELQNAADQSALAAAAQLDGLTGTCSRAGQAARAFVANQTRFSNDGGGLAITIANETVCDAVGSIRFYQDKLRTMAATNDGNANFVQVTVGTRTANYALTPIVGAFNSGPITGTAFAGMGSAICRIPPVFICNPDELSTNTNKFLEFDISGRVGDGMELISDEKYAPGNVGFLSAGGGANDLAKALGWDRQPFDCVAADFNDAVRVETEPGVKEAVRSSFNTRFDLQDGSGLGCVSPGNCPPSRNVRKDLVESSCDWSYPTAAGTRYFPSTNSPLPTTTTPQVMGHPRDICHANDSFSCGGNERFGDGTWDRAAYFRSNYGWDDVRWRDEMTTAGFAPDSLTRYQLYRWEARQAENGFPSYLGSASAAGGTKRGSPQCSSAMTPATGVIPVDGFPDRRLITAAVINCTANNLKGRGKDVPVAQWIDLFLVEPAFERSDVSDKSEIYTEIIRENTLRGGNTGGGTFRRDAPYLIE